MIEDTDDEFRALLTKKKEALDKEDLFALLGVNTQTSKADIAKAYFDLAKRIHPDRVSKRGLKDVAELSTRLFGSVSEAHSVLLDPKRREDYMRRKPLAGATTADIQVHMATQSTQELLRKNFDEMGLGAKEAAKIFFHKSESLFKKGAYLEAEQAMQKALEGDPDNVRYHLAMGKAVYHNTQLADGKRLATARQHLEKALAGEADNPETNYYMARLWRESGDQDKCRDHLMKAIAKRPNFIEAKRELRLLDMRVQSAKDSVATIRPGGDSKSAAKPSTAKPSGARVKPGAKPEPEPSRWPFGLDRLFRKK